MNIDRVQEFIFALPIFKVQIKKRQIHNRLVSRG